MGAWGFKGIGYWVFRSFGIYSNLVIGAGGLSWDAAVSSQAYVGYLVSCLWEPQPNSVIQHLLIEEYT